MTRTSRGWLSATAGVAVTAAVVAALPLMGSTSARADQPSAATAACAASASWVSSPSLPNFSQDPNSLCQFYQYAWQSFLWLVSPSAGQGSPLNFETYQSVTQVFQGAAAVPAAEGSLAGRARTPRLIFQRDAKSRMVAKTTPQGIEFQEDTQAGSRGILVAQDKMITYYEQLLDPVAVQFIDACDLTVKACQTASWASSLRMPAGAIEVKAAWRPMSKYDANVKDFFTMTGAEIENPDGTLSKPDFMALTGFHLVYTTANHPEMIWATFEHVANAPNGPCTGPTKPPAGFKNWSYNNASATSCANVNSWPSPAPSPAAKPPYFPVTQAFQNYAFGQGPFSNCLTNQAQNTSTIQALNQSVLSVLPSGSVWRNYFLSGAIWTNGQLPPQAPLQANGQPNSQCNEAGSLALANATMETFTQFPNPVPKPFPSPAPVQNCFTCHSNQFGTSTVAPFFVSHAFFAATNTASCPVSSIPAACQQTQAAARASGR